MSFSLVLHEGDVPFDSRTWYYFERTGSLLYFGRCESQTCSDGALGAATFDAAAHAHWRFRHDAELELLFLEVSLDGMNYMAGATPAGVTTDQLACVGVDLASYELESDRAGSVAFDDLRSE
jgi:hypothetical protein